MMKSFMGIFNQPSTVSINGSNYTGHSISIVDGKVIVDGAEQGAISGLQVVVNIVGDPREVSTVSGNINVQGDCGWVRTTSGDIRCHDVEGNVETVSGDVECMNVSGSVRTVSGDIEKR